MLKCDECEKTLIGKDEEVATYVSVATGSLLVSNRECGLPRNAYEADHRIADFLLHLCVGCRDKMVLGVTKMVGGCCKEQATKNAVLQLHD